MLFFKYKKVIEVIEEVICYLIINIKEVIRVERI